MSCLACLGFIKREVLWGEKTSEKRRVLEPYIFRRPLEGASQRTVAETSDRALTKK